LPDSQLERISYDPTTKLLWLTGGMTSQELSLLLSLSADSPYQHAIQHLYNAQIGSASVPLAIMPVLAFTVSSKSKPSPDGVSYDPVQKQLQFIGTMSAGERTLLLSLSGDVHYRLEIDNLFQMRWSPGGELAIVATPNTAKISMGAAALLAQTRFQCMTPPFPRRED
jgi:hypothetical protein